MKKQNNYNQANMIMIVVLLSVAAMSSVQWAESRKGRQLVTTTSHVNLKKQNVGGQGGMVSYEDLLIAQYLDELRNSQKKRGTQVHDEYV